MSVTCRHAKCQRRSGIENILPIIHTPYYVYERFLG